jgi:hypothetical protein
MNAKTAKRLRSIATTMAVAAEQQGQNVARVRYIVQNGTIALHPRSWKGIYRSLKKDLKATSTKRELQAL